MGHKSRLDAVAEKHGLRPLSGDMAPNDYIEYALDLMSLALGLIDAASVHQPKTVTEMFRERNIEG